MSLEIELHRDWVKVLPRLLGVTVFLVVTAGLYGLGDVVSPRTPDGRPVLLLPDVRAVEVYRRQAVAWVLAWRDLEAGLRAVLGAPDSGLLEQSRKAQAGFEAAIQLAREVDAAEAPPTLLGLHDQVVLTAQGYVDTSVAVNRWLSAPSPENRAVADQAYQVAAATLAQVEANAWLQPTGK